MTTIELDDALCALSAEAQAAFAAWVVACTPALAERAQAAVAAKSTLVRGVRVVSLSHEAALLATRQSPVEEFEASYASTRGAHAHWVARAA